MNFDHKKATQCLNHFVLKEGGQIDRLKALKLVYLADRYHLRKYGRLITNDMYFAMRLGLVASTTENISEGSEYLGLAEKQYSSQYFCLKSNHNLVSLNPVDYDVFSDSDVEALDFAWDTFGSLDNFTLSDLTHKYPEWAKNEQTFKMNPRARIQIQKEEFLDDPAREIEKCFDLTDEDKGNLREYLKETDCIESLWR